MKKDCRVMTDATLIAADASLDSLVHVDPEQAKQEANAQHHQRGTFDGRAPRKLSNQTHRSCTDPEATLAQKKGTPRQLKYKVHQTIDADSRVILDTEVTTGARHDNQPYLAQLERVRACYQITIGEATADRGYGSADIIRALQAQQARTYIPLWSGRVGNSKYLKGELVYEKEHDRFRCPEGKYLIPNPTVTENHKRYVTSSEDCRNCPQAATCPAKRRTSTSHQRLVKRNLDQDLFEEVLATCKNRRSSNERPSGCGSARGCSPSRSNTTASRERSTAGVPKCRSRPTSARSCRTSNACSSHFIAGC